MIVSWEFSGFGPNLEKHPSDFFHLCAVMFGRIFHRRASGFLSSRPCLLRSPCIPSSGLWGRTHTAQSCWVAGCPKAMGSLWEPWLHQSSQQGSHVRGSNRELCKVHQSKTSSNSSELDPQHVYGQFSGTQYRDGIWMDVRSKVTEVLISCS